jgi:hypothetical protein
MAKKKRRTPDWDYPGSPIGKKGPRKKNPKYLRNMKRGWQPQDLRMLKQLVKENTPTRIICLKLGRSEASVRYKAGAEGISLKPTNRSPNKGRKKKR